MNVKAFLNILDKEFFTGVPDSQLKPLCDYLVDNYGYGNKHIIAANEGNSVAIAAGYYMATGKIPVVYLQNSGEGNIINPVASLLSENVYGIPVIFVIGWRGEPGVKDEPQHIFQGKITEQLLKDINVEYCIVDKETTSIDLELKYKKYTENLNKGKSVAFLMKKGALTYENKVEYKNGHLINRERAIEKIISYTFEDLVVSTTGKISRELFEIREKEGYSHNKDFLTVGSMGHTSSIALGLALSKPGKKVWCLDGDGAALMHLGAMGVIGANGPNNLVHIILNNEAHESVGGMKTAAEHIDFGEIARGCGYKIIKNVRDYITLEKVLKEARESNQLMFIEIKCSIESRSNLHRPTRSPRDNINDFMKFVAK